MRDTLLAIKLACDADLCSAGHIKELRRIYTLRDLHRDYAVFSRAQAAREEVMKHVARLGAVVAMGQA